MRETVQTKLKIGKMVRERIQKLTLPAGLVERVINLFPGNGLLAIRSSSFDEDTDANGSAAGIYKTEGSVAKVNVEQAIKNVVSSFFSEKAISYRRLHQLSDSPMFAILIQPFIDGPGGAGFSSGNGSDWEIAVGKTPSEIVGNGSHNEHDSYKKEGAEVRTVRNKRWLDDKQVNQVAQYLLQAERCLGSAVDIEFVGDRNGQIKILQMRVLKKAQNPVFDKDQEAGNLTDLETNSISEITLPQTEDGQRLRLIITDPEVDLDQFQGLFFRFLVKHRRKVKEIVIPKRIPRTNHFANICENLGIKLTFRNG